MILMAATARRFPGALAFYVCAAATLALSTSPIPASAEIPAFTSTRVPVVDRWSDHVVVLWEDWLAVGGVVDQVPAVLGEAAGQDFADLDAAIAEVRRRQMPLYVDDDAYRFVVPLNTEDGAQGRLIVALQNTVKSMQTVRTQARGLDDRRAALQQLLEAHRPQLALEFPGHPTDAAVEVPRADAVVQSQLDALDALQADVERCLATVDRFFVDLAAASSHALGQGASP